MEGWKKSDDPPERGVSGPKASHQVVGIEWEAKSLSMALYICMRHPYANSKEDAQRKSFWELMNCVLVHPPPVLPTDAGFSEDLQDPPALLDVKCT